MIGSSSRGEKALSWQSPGGALTAFELGNGTWSVPFPDRARALPRETVACQRQDGGVVDLTRSLASLSEGGAERL